MRHPRPTIVVPDGAMPPGGLHCTTMPTFEYRLRNILRAPDSEPVSAEDYKAITGARKGVLEATAIERSYKTVLENYFEFEAELHRCRVRTTAGLGQDWSSFQEDLMHVNRRLGNLLSSSRGLLDSVQRRLARLYSESSRVVRQFQAHRKAAMQDDIDFWAVEAIRDHVQHYDVGVHRMSIAWPGPGVTDDDRDNGVSPFCLIDRLEAGQRSPNKKQLARLRGRHGNHLLLSTLVRSHTDTLSRLHNGVRESMGSDLQTWEATLEDALDRPRWQNNVLALEVVKLQGDQDIEVGQIFRGLVTQRRELARAQAYVTDFGQAGGRRERG
jgi:hypothetical protein